MPDVAGDPERIGEIMSLPSYIGANEDAVAAVRRRVGQQDQRAFEPVRNAPNTGHRFLRYWRVIGQPLLGLALFIVAAMTCAGWFIAGAS
jgi:hypothetical protein